MEDEVACLVGLASMNQSKITVDGFLENEVAVAKAARLARLGNEHRLRLLAILLFVLEHEFTLVDGRTVAGGRVEGRDTSRTSADALSKRALWAEIELHLASEKLVSELAVATEERARNRANSALASQ